MRRFDTAGLFDALAAGGRLDGANADGLAAAVAEFHHGAAAAPADPRRGSFSAVAAPMLENFDALRELHPGGDARDRLERLAAWTGRTLERRRDLIEARRRDHFVRECHGDLHLGNVALVDGRPVLFDCIEFDPGLRWIDVMNDAAFAFMDLAEYGLDGLAWRFLNGYVERTGDYEGVPLRRLYAVYRAVVRAKIALLRTAQQGEQAQAAGTASFMHRLALAERLAAEPPPCLLLTCGVSGSGKTTAAGFLLERLGAVRLRSDVERKRLFGLEHRDRAAGAPGAGIYSEEAGARTYDRLAGLAAILLEAGESVIVDAAFLRRSERERFRSVADAHGAAFGIAACRAPAEAMRQRIVARAAQGRDASDADLAVLEDQLRRGEMPGSDEEDVTEIATDGGFAALAQACAALASRLQHPPRTAQGAGG